MPVRSANPETDDVGRFNRLSASQANTWDDCPRLWYYQNKMRLKFPQTPPLFLGRAVEECVCRVLLESPGLVFANAPLDVMANGADNLLPLFDDELPDDFMSWCESRVDTHWPKIRDEMQQTMQKHAGVFRNNESLKEGVKKINNIYKKFKNISISDKSKIFNTEFTELLEFKNLLDNAMVTMYSAN